ncbi:hypothetical protein YTPLAS18_06360 [Nitrospira sp.]|nr:hypothetical protein YTPLAS18_06360 [Nitrospira sp.]
MIARAIWLIFFSCTFLLTAVPAHAHGTGEHIMGTVTAVSETQLDITTQKGQAMSVRVTEKTEFRPRGKDTTATRPQVGDRVVVEATGKGADMTATEVLFASPKGKGASK